MASTKPWDDLPAELQLMLLNAFIENGNKLSHLATVSREWQTVVEPHNFGRLKLSPSCLTDFASKTRRNRHLVGYIWFCIELEEYDNGLNMPRPQIFSILETNLVASALRDMFLNLSTWTPTPTDKLVLDISIYSPSDFEHGFKDLTFRPDILNQRSLRRRLSPVLLKIFDQKSTYIQAINGERSRLYPNIKGTFGFIGRHGIFDDWESQTSWWQRLPSVPAVTGIFLRQQTRRQWSPSTLARMFTRLPRLQEIYYEPWRDWVPENPLITNAEFEAFFTSLASKDLQKLVVFENFHSSVPIIDPGLGHICALIRAASRMAAETSLKLEHFSGSFLIDASEFFASCKSSWKWSKLRSLTITSQKLTAGEDQLAISEMLKLAAAAAMNMSRLDTLEIWNGESKSATLFKYQSNRGQTYAALTWRSTWGFVIEQSVILAWMSVANKHGARGLTSCTELLDVRDKVKFHGDAIRYLQLSQPVARPVSLTQIRAEQVIHSQWDKWQKKRRKEFLDNMIRGADPDNREHQQVLADLRTRFREDEEEEGEGD